MTTADAYVPPQNLEAEESVLGAMMVSETAVASVIVDVHLGGDDFYRQRHRIIFNAVHSLHSKGEPVDALTVTEQLTSLGELTEAGGKEFVSSLASTVPVAGNADHYARIVKANAMLRRLLQTSQRIQKSVHEREGEPRDLVEQAERLLFEVAHDTASQDFASLQDVLVRETTRLEELAEGKRDLTGTPSGFSDLDAITGGFQPGNLIIVAARPAMGKCLAGSSLVFDPTTGKRRRMDELHELASQGKDVWVTSLSEELHLRKSRATAVAASGVRPTFKLTTLSGRTVTATGNHPLLTISGWEQIHSLGAGDRIAVPRTLTSERVDLSRGELVLAGLRDSERRNYPALPDDSDARYEGQRSDVWWDEIASIEPAGDRMTYDLQVPGDECFVADDIVVHNSALVANIAENVAIEKKQPVAFFSLEMSETELAHRFLASQAKIPGDKLRKGQVKTLWPKVLKASNRLENAPIWLDTSSDLSILDVRAKARRLYSKEGGLGLIIVDYMQLMRADDPRMSRVEQVGSISRGLKLLAGELNVPVLALSQLSRAPELRPDKKPILSDLRESGNLEQDADVVCFIFRQEYYEDDPDEDTRGKADIIVAKHRNGPIGNVELAFLSPYPKFQNLSRRRDMHSPPPPRDEFEPPDDPIGDEVDDF